MKKSQKHPNHPKQTGAQMLLYGYHAVRAAWLNPSRRVEALYITDQAQKGFETVLQEGHKAGLQRPAPLKTDKKNIEKMLHRGAVHQGLVLAAPPLEDMMIQDLLIQAQEKQKTLFIVLDQVTDPHNVGAILRSVCAFGADGVIMQRKHAPDLTGALAKTACGAVEHVPVAYETNLNRALEALKDQGYFIYGLDERGEVNLPDLQVHDRAVLVLGAEGPGLRRLIRENCDVLARLPTSGVVASLNVSNAAAVALYGILNN